MPKNTAANKSKLRSRSTRKPLRDVSNGRISVSSCGLKKISGEGGGEKGSDSFDRILLVYSDISSLLRQIDELVVQAFQTKSNEGWKEIKEFANMLSDMQTTLKSWVPKFQKALAGQQQPVRSDENKPDQPFEQTAVCVPKESNDNSIQSPEPTKWESLLSPSPLVSWRAECNIEGGRQLFLLTPLPQPKSFSSKLQPTSVDARRMTTSEETAYPVSLLTTMPNKGVDLAESESTKSPANPEPINHSVFVMTPCLKMSPPKSCILLEPVSTFSKKKKQDIPLAAVVHNPDSLEPESSRSQSSGDLNVKYPELLGINMNKLGNKVADKESPAWLISPPKSCAIMEPLDEKLLNYPAGIFCSVDLAENTPMMKEPTSIARTGRHPGENTLKRELWMKFEAASSHDIVHFNHSKKGFLDRLEEASEE